MSIFQKIKNLFIKKDIKTKEPKIEIFESKNIVNEKKEIILKSDFESYTNIWEYIKPKENTQAHHILSVVILDDWLDMDQIREKIKNLFFIEYKHEKSLYPYIKTLVDVGLLETTSVGGKRKWKKKNLSIKTKNFNESFEKIN